MVPVVVPVLYRFLAVLISLSSATTIAPDPAMLTKMLPVVAEIAPAETSDSIVVFKKAVPSNDSPCANACNIPRVAYPRPVRSAAPKTDRSYTIFLNSPQINQKS